MQQSLKPLSRNFYARDSVVVANDLLGKIIVRSCGGVLTRWMIVETEAYRSTDDPACHAYRGLTQRTAPLFGPVGHLYVYFIYGCHYCMNIVSKDRKTPAGGVLIRAIELLDKADKAVKTNGPGKLTKVLGISRHHNNYDITMPGDIFVTDGCEIKSSEIVAALRVGILVSGDKAWRFYIKNNPMVSKK